MERYTCLQVTLNAIVVMPAEWSRTLRGIIKSRARRQMQPIAFVNRLEFEPRSHDTDEDNR